MGTLKVLITGGSGFIGTNLINKLIEQEVSFINIDKNKPNVRTHNKYWKECNILNYEGLYELLNDFQPTHVIHLAARTDTSSNVLDDYHENVEGTRNLLAIVKQIRSIERIIVTSTQFVNQYNGVPKNDRDYAPHTVYGESKVINEKDTRNANLSCIWTIIRPTNIWGPWHNRYPYEFWKILSQNKYIHPDRKNIIRSYGYVGNVVWQILNILKAPDEVVNKKVFYVGDDPIKLYDWVNGFSNKQLGKNVTVVPVLIIRCLAMIGEVLKKINVKFPITLSRYKSMTTSNDVSMNVIQEAFGKPPYSLEEGIEETVIWMKIYHPNLVKFP